MTVAAAVDLPAMIRGVRKRLGLSQPRFAAQFGFSLGSLRDWEQGRKTPDQAALAYLHVIARAPQVVQAALNEKPPS